MVHPFSVRMIMWVSEPVSLCWEVLAQADALVRLSSVLMWCIPLSRAWALSIKNTAKIPFWFSAQSQHSKPWDIWLSAIWDTEEVYLLSTPASVFMNSAALSLSLLSSAALCPPFEGLWSNIQRKPGKPWEDSSALSYPVTILSCRASDYEKTQWVSAASSSDHLLHSLWQPCAVFPRDQIASL